MSSFYKVELTLVLLLVSIGGARGQSSETGTKYAPHITQIDTKTFPLIRVYISITDQNGNPLPDDLPVDLFLYEEGSQVSHQVLSTGRAISSVLVLDESGSMDDGEKLEKAKEAAARYIEMADPQHEIALVGFSNTPHTVAKFGSDRGAVLAQVGNLSATGRTALQDGIGVALDLLRSRHGRRVIVAMTDGIENSSRYYSQAKGLSRLLQIAKANGVSIYTVGLGKDVNDFYLRRYEETNGTYFFSPSPNELKSIFERTINLLAKEVVIEYTTASPDRDGMSPKISVKLKVKDAITNHEASYTKRGVIPHVRGNHFPYLMLVLLLFILPTASTWVSRLASVIRLRSRSVERLSETSDPVRKKLRDRNSPEEDEYRFKAGDLVVKCPTPDCPRVYYVRSWRYSKCHCVCDGRGRYCYVSVLPKWLRKALDFLSGQHSSDDAGRSFLCRCADDVEGY
jgi:Ca-activated chloride channel homolog